MSRLTIEERALLAARVGKGETQTMTIRVPVGTQQVLAALGEYQGQSGAQYATGLLTEHAYAAVRPAGVVEGLREMPERLNGIVTAAGDSLITLSERLSVSPLTLMSPDLLLAWLGNSHDNLRRLARWLGAAPEYLLGLQPGLRAPLAGVDPLSPEALTLAQSAARSHGREIWVYGSGPGAPVLVVNDEDITPWSQTPVAWVQPGTRKHGRLLWLAAFLSFLPEGVTLHYAQERAERLLAAASGTVHAAALRRTATELNENPNSEAKGIGLSSQNYSKVTLTDGLQTLQSLWTSTFPAQPFPEAALKRVLYI